MKRLLCCLFAIFALAGCAQQPKEETGDKVRKEFIQQKYNEFTKNIEKYSEKTGYIYETRIGEDEFIYEGFFHNADKLEELDKYASDNKCNLFKTVTDYTRGKVYVYMCYYNRIREYWYSKYESCKFAEGTGADSYIYI